MPMVKIDIWEGRNRETKRKLIKSVAKAVAESLEIPIEHINIVINEVSKDNWGLEGEQASRIY
jgi:4-oxalocrotonate tautomerase